MTLQSLLCLAGPEALSRLDFCRAVARHLGMAESIVQGSTYDLPTPSPADISMSIQRLEGALGRRPRTLSDALAVIGAKL